MGDPELPFRSPKELIVVEGGCPHIHQLDIAQGIDAANALVPPIPVQPAEEVEVEPVCVPPSIDVDTQSLQHWW